MVSDYFAELYVAGRFADAGWNVYFPHRDHGFDFIVTKKADTGAYLIRPVQVKGKYPNAEKTNKRTYGYTGRLTQVHPEMVLAIPYFSMTSTATPVCTAYMPLTLVRPSPRGFRCHPAIFSSGQPIPRRDFARYFDKSGLELLASSTWSVA